MITPLISIVTAEAPPLAIRLLVEVAYRTFCPFTTRAIGAPAAPIVIEFPLPSAILLIFCHVAVPELSIAVNK